MIRPGAQVLVAVVLCAPIIAVARPPQASAAKNGHAKSSSVGVTSVIPSPNRLHAVQVTRKGKVRLDGQSIPSGEGRILGAPIWRQDSEALAFLQRSRYGMALVVVRRASRREPLVWHLPATADGLSKVFWIAPRRIGIGAKELVPRLVVNWSTTTRDYY